MKSQDHIESILRNFAEIKMRHFLAQQCNIKSLEELQAIILANQAMEDRDD